MRVLLIGGTRFIGKAVAERLVEAGHDVTVFHRGEHEEGLPDAVRHIHAPDARFPIQQFPDEVRAVAADVVLHMTAFGEADARVFVDTFAGHAGRAVVISSMDVYRAFGLVLGTEEGAPDPLPITEASPVRAKLYPYRGLEPRSPDDPQPWRDDYDKILVERVVLATRDLPATVLRLPAVYGPGDYQHRLWEFLPAMLADRPAIILPEDYARWRWTRGYIGNVADAIARVVAPGKAADITGEIFNVGEEEPRTTQQWAEAIGAAVGWRGEVVTAPRDALPPALREDDLHTAQELVVSSRKLRERLGYQDRTAPTEAMAASVAWERAHPPAQVPERDYAAEDALLRQMGRG